MHPDLEKLLDLQAKDDVLSSIDARLEEFAEEIGRLDHELTRARAEVDAARRARDAGVKRKEEVESKVEGLRVLQDRRRQRLELAKTTRELQALGSELEVARTVLAREEAEWFRADESVTSLEATVASAESALADAEGAQTARRDELAAQVADVETERSAAAAAREHSAGRLDRPLLQRYDRLRRSRAPQVVVAIRNDACGACYTTIPMSRRSHIRTGFLLEGCEACGVILYAASESE